MTVVDPLAVVVHLSIGNPPTGNTGAHIPIWSFTLGQNFDHDCETGLSVKTCGETSSQKFSNTLDFLP